MQYRTLEEEVIDRGKGGRGVNGNCHMDEYRFQHITVQSRYHLFKPSPSSLIPSSPVVSV